MYYLLPVILSNHAIGVVGEQRRHRRYRCRRPGLRTVVIGHRCRGRVGHNIGLMRCARFAGRLLLTTCRLVLVVQMLRLLLVLLTLELVSVRLVALLQRLLRRPVEVLLMIVHTLQVVLILVVLVVMVLCVLLRALDVLMMRHHYRHWWRWRHHLGWLRIFLVIRVRMPTVRVDVDVLHHRHVSRILRRYIRILIAHVVVVIQCTATAVGMANRCHHRPAAVVVSWRGVVRRAVVGGNRRTRHQVVVGLLDVIVVTVGGQLLRVQLLLVLTMKRRLAASQRTGFVKLAVLSRRRICGGRVRIVCGGLLQQLTIRLRRLRLLL